MIKSQTIANFSKLKRSTQIGTPPKTTTATNSLAALGSPWPAKITSLGGSAFNLNGNNGTSDTRDPKAPNQSQSPNQKRPTKTFKFARDLSHLSQQNNGYKRIFPLTGDNDFDLEIKAFNSSTQEKIAIFVDKETLRKNNPYFQAMYNPDSNWDEARCANASQLNCSLSQSPDGKHRRSREKWKAELPATLVCPGSFPDLRTHLFGTDNV